MLINSSTFKTKGDVPKRVVCRALYNFMQKQGYNLVRERNVAFFMHQAAYDTEYSQFWQHPITGLMVSVCPRKHLDKNGFLQWWVEERLKANGEELNSMEQFLDAQGFLASEST